MKAIFRLVSVFAVSALLALVAGCGGGSSNSSARANVRLVNATTSATLTLNLVSSANSGSTATYGPAAAGGATEYSVCVVPEGTRPQVRPSGLTASVPLAPAATKLPLSWPTP